MDARQQLMPSSNQSSALPWVFVLLALTLLLGGCDRAERELRMHIPADRPVDERALRSVFEEQSWIRFTESESASHLSAIDAITSNQADLALVENSTAFTSGVRAVLPVFVSVLHVLVRDDFVPASVDQPLRGASIYIMNQSSAGHDFTQLVTSRQGLAPDQFTTTDSRIPGETDVIVYFGPIAPDNTRWYVPGYTLVSLTNEFNPHPRFYQQGIGYAASKLQPAVIPPHTYALPGNEQEIDSLSVDTLLVARKELHESSIYDLTRTLLEQKPRFVAVAPSLFSGINESFAPLDLNFPLHAGARRYFRRDEPGTLERYAETINLLIYMLFLFITGLFGLARWRAQRKKDRIDRFYTEVISIRDRIATENPDTLLEELERLERTAFDSLIREKLAANESFRIFTDQMARLRDDLREKRATHD